MIRRNAALALAFAALGGMTPLLRAADEPFDPLAEVESDTAPLLANDYKDEPNLLRFAPPAGCRLIQRGGLGQELVTFVNDARQWGGSVQVVSLKSDATVDEFLKQSAAELAKSFKGLQVLDSKQITVSGKKAGRQRMVMEAEITPTGPGGAPIKNAPKERVALVRQMLAVRMEPAKFMVLNFYAPLATQADAIKTFEAMLPRFEVLDARKVDQRRREAIDTGRKWLKDQRAEDLASKLLAKPQYYRMKVDGKDVGYLAMTEAEAVRDGYSGVAVNVASRSFPGALGGRADKSVITSKAEAFWSYRDDPYKNQSVRPRTFKDGDKAFYSCWAVATENKYLTVHPVTGQPASGVNWTNEMGTMALDFPSATSREPLRDEKGEIVKDKDGNPVLRTRVAAPTPDNTPTLITVVRTGDQRLDASTANKSHKWAVEPDKPGTPAPLPKTLEYLWPRLVDLSKPASMGFVVFNAQTTKLGLRTLTVHGKQSVVIDGKTQQAVRLSDELDPGVTSLWVDSTGKILMMRTSDGTTLTPTTEETMAKMWANRLAELNNMPPLAPSQIVTPAQENPNVTPGLIIKRPNSLAPDNR